MISFADSSNLNQYKKSKQAGHSSASNSPATTIISTSAKSVSQASRRTLGSEEEPQIGKERLSAKDAFATVDPGMVVRQSKTHTTILNKFPVVQQHVSDCLSKIASNSASSCISLMFSGCCLHEHVSKPNWAIDRWWSHGTLGVVSTTSYSFKMDVIML